MNSTTYRINVGDVIRGFVDCTDPPKIKRFLVLSVEKPALYFLLNSNITPFAQSQPHLASQNLSIPEEHYCFLDKDSYLDASEVFAFNASSREMDIINGDSQFLGCADNELIQRVHDSVGESSTLSNKFIIRIQADLTQHLAEINAS